jgi:hypothetical protein
MRHLQRKRLLLEVFHNKYNYGFLRRPMSIGKVAIPLDALLTKTSISGWFDVSYISSCRTGVTNSHFALQLLDNTRKKTGGKLKIQLGLREPLNGQDIVNKSERWLVLDNPGQQTSQLMHSAGFTTAPYLPTSSSNVPAAIPSTTPTIPSPVQATPPQPQGDTMEPSITANSPATKKPAADTTNSELESAEEEIDR